MTSSLKIFRTDLVSKLLYFLIDTFCIVGGIALVLFLLKLKSYYYKTINTEGMHEMADFAISAGM